MINKAKATKWMLSSVLLATLSTQVLGAEVYAQGSASVEENTMKSTEQDELSKVSAELLAIELSEDQRTLLVNVQLDSTYTAALTLNNNPTYYEGAFTAVIPTAVTDNLTIEIFNAKQELVKQTVIIPNDVYRKRAGSKQENQSEVAIKDTYNSEDIKEMEEAILSYERSSDVQSLLSGEELSSIQFDNPVSRMLNVSSSGDMEIDNGLYTVRSGDTFTKIASAFGMSKMQLRVWNSQVTDVNILSIGQKLAVTRQGYEQTLSDSQKSILHKGNNPSLFSNVNEFIDYFAPLSIEISNQEGEEALYPSLMMAQAIHESGVERGIGMSQLSRPPYYNLSGIKARGTTPAVLMWTWEAVRDQYNEVKDSNTIAVDMLEPFQNFNSYEEALQRYANLLRYGRGTGEDHYYRGTWRSNTSNVWEALDKGGLRAYATDPRYFTAIGRIIERHNLTRFDNTRRLEGENRFETAVSISQQGWVDSDTVIISDGFGFADALAGTPLATALDAPVLLTRKNRLDNSSIDEIKRLGARKAIILGGPQSISSEVTDQLVSTGLTVDRLAGDNRYETARIIADEISSQISVTEGILVSGEDFADAMSIAPYAARNGLPIYLTRSNSLSRQVEAASHIENWIIVGGENAVSEAVSNALIAQGKSVKRLAGADRYETNQKVVEYAGSNGKSAFVATGQDFADALTGSVLAGKTENNIILTRNSERIMSRQIDLVKQRGYTQFTLLGGRKVLPENIADSFSALRFIK